MRIRRSTAGVTVLLAILLLVLHSGWSSLHPVSPLLPFHPPSIAHADLPASYAHEYRNDHYGFSFRYPSGWALQENPNLILLTRHTTTLYISYRWLTEDTVIYDASTPLGTFQANGTTPFLSKKLLRRLLVFEGKEKGVYYHPPEVSAGKLVFSFRLKDLDSDYERIDLDQSTQDEADSIITTFDTFLPFQTEFSPLQRSDDADIPTITPPATPTPTTAPPATPTPAIVPTQSPTSTPPPPSATATPSPTPVPPADADMQQFTTSISLTQPLDADFAVLQAELEAMVNGWSNQNAVSVTDLQTGQTISINGSRPQVAACTIKIGIIIAVAQDIERGLYTQQDVAGLVQSMMGPSNTPPARELLRIVGGGDVGNGIHRVNQIMWGLGATGSILTHPPGYYGEEYGYASSHSTRDNLLTTDDLVVILSALYHGEVLTPHGTAYVLQTMTIAPAWMNRSFGAPLPAGVKLYHKVGQIYGPHNTWNDAGIIVFERNGREYAYALAYLGSYGAGWQESYNHAMAVSEVVWRYFSTKY